MAGARFRVTMEVLATTIDEGAPMNWDSLKPLLELLKLVLRPLFMTFFAALCATLLFAPPQWLAVFGLDAWVQAHRPLIGGAFLVSVTLVGFILTTRWLLRHRVRTRLKEATHDELAVLAQFKARGSRTLLLSPMDPAVSGLVADGVLYRTGAVGTLDGMAYTLSKPAWQWLVDQHLAPP